MPLGNDQLEALRIACNRDLGDPDLWFEPDGYRGSLALCVIDSIYSTGAHYSSAVNVVRRYRDYRAKQGGDANADGTSELLTTIDELGGADYWASRIGNRRPTSTAKGAPLKAEAILQVAEALSNLSIHSADELRAAAANVNSLRSAKRAWTATPGQRSGLTWEYALMLAGVPGVKADRMVTRYVARALDREVDEVSRADAADMVRRLAQVNGWDVIRTDHAIWRFESGRPVNIDRDPIDPM
ncbi:heme peroxidase [Mycobacterium sp. URHB0021]|jgi:hypothetical protein